MIMKDKDENDENEIIGEVVANAIDVITTVTLEGKSKNKTSLADKSESYHIERAFSHLRKELAQDMRQPHLEHALWRVAVALYKKKVENK